MKSEQPARRGKRKRFSHKLEREVGFLSEQSKKTAKQGQLNI